MLNYNASSPPLNTMQKLGGSIKHKTGSLAGIESTSLLKTNHQTNSVVMVHNLLKDGGPVAPAGTSNIKQSSGQLARYTVRISCDFIIEVCFFDSRKDSKACRRSGLPIRYPQVESTKTRMRRSGKHRCRVASTIRVWADWAAFPRYNPLTRLGPSFRSMLAL